MKVTSCLFGLVVCGALSTGAAAARHHHHFRHGNAGVVHADTPANAKSDVKSQSKTDGDAGIRGVKTSTSGVTEKSESGHVKDAHTPTGQNLGNKESVADTGVDTRITVHQGHEKRKTVHELLFKKKGKVAIGAAPSQQHFRQVLRTIHRNAIGALVVHEKTPAHDAAASSPGKEPAANVNSSKAPDPPPASGAAIPNSKPAAATGVAAPASSNPPAPQTDNRQANGAALAIVTKNALSINGTGLNRPGVGTTAVTGSPKVVAGVISGNSVHLKHP